VRCGHDASEHESLGQWAEGEPMMITEMGQRVRRLKVKECS
jgi:hypothetical protein